MYDFAHELLDIMDRNYDVITFILKHFVLRRPRVATIFIKTTFQDSKN